MASESGMRRERLNNGIDAFQMPSRQASVNR